MFATLFFVYVGYKRMIQGYKPARYYFTGWVAFMFGVLMVEHFEEFVYFDTMLLGSTIEAIMLALALAYKIQQIQSEKETQQALMIQQNKLASMGELLGNIAHQWRQPLTNLSYILMNIEEIDEKEKLNKKLNEGTKQLEFMSQTIDDFRDFYDPNKAKEKFNIVKVTQHVLDLMNFENIKIIFEKQEDREIFNYKNEYKQLLLNLLSNAKEALIQSKVEKPTITIEIDKNSIFVSDNAGGIKEANLQKIFKPYFTTKEKSSGIGLYMSKMIVEKNMGGSLNVHNKNDGAVFEINIY